MLWPNPSACVADRGASCSLPDNWLTFCSTAIQTIVGAAANESSQERYQGWTGKDSAGHDAQSLIPAEKGEFRWLGEEKNTSFAQGWVADLCSKLTEKTFGNVHANCLPVSMSVFHLLIYNSCNMHCIITVHIMSQYTGCVLKDTSCDTVSSDYACRLSGY